MPDDEEGGVLVLQTFGVSSDAELVYEALVRDPGSTPDSISVELTPQARSTALDELSERGLVLPGEDGHVDVVPPERALTHLIEEEERALAARLSGLNRARESIPGVVAEYLTSRTSGSAEHVELIEDPELVRTRIFQLAADARASVWAVHPGAALTGEQIAAALISDREIAARGLDCRMIVAPTSLGPPEWGDYLTELQAIGHQLRVHEAATQVALVFDGEHAVIPSTTDGVPPFGAYVLHGPALVAPVVALFEEHWTTGAHFVAGESDRGVTDERVAQVVSFLARGMKDEAIARRLGVSTRTMRRLVAATMEHLGADSRFQAGIEAVRRGYVD